MGTPRPQRTLTISSGAKFPDLPRPHPACAQTQLPVVNGVSIFIQMVHLIDTWLMLAGFVATTLNLFDRALEDAWQRRAEWQKIGPRARKRVASLIAADPVGDFCDLLIRVSEEQRDRR